MRFLRNVLSRLWLYLVWLVASVMIWGQVYSVITDTTPDKKISVYVDSPSVMSTEFSAELEKTMPEGLKFIKVRPFTYAMFYDETFFNADIYIVPESEIEALADAFTGDGIEVKGGALGYFETDGEAYYLFFGKDSQHLSDGKAAEVGERILNMR